METPFGLASHQYGAGGDPGQTKIPSKYEKSPYITTAAVVEGGATGEVVHCIVVTLHPNFSASHDLDDFTSKTKTR